MDTRAHILDCTFACLHRKGYAGTTTAEVCRSGTLSRGALLHHFPTRARLMSAAVEDVIGRRTTEVEAALIGLPDGPERISAAIERLYALRAGPVFEVWMELAVAARTNPALRSDLRTHMHTYTERAQTVVGAVVGDGALTTLAAMDGLGLAAIYAGPDAQAAVVQALGGPIRPEPEVTVGTLSDALNDLVSIADALATTDR